MGSGLFAPTHIVILVAVLALLFGASRLPGAASSIGRSMHIFKRSVQGLGDDAGNATATAANPNTGSLRQSGTAALPGQDSTQQQLADLQRQIQDLQRQAATPSGATAPTTQTQQPL